MPKKYGVQNLMKKTGNQATQMFIYSLVPQNSRRPSTRASSPKRPSTRASSPNPREIKKEVAEKNKIRIKGNPSARLTRYNSPDRGANSVLKRRQREHYTYRVR